LIQRFLDPFWLSILPSRSHADGLNFSMAYFILPFLKF